MEQREQDREQFEIPEEFAGMKFGGLASDVIGYVKHERDTWRNISFVLAVCSVILAGTLAAVILK